LLLQLEINIENSNTALLALKVSSEKYYSEIAKEIAKYLSAVANANNFYLEQKSIMLLSVMELWILIDECAALLFSLLKEYNPGFSTNISDVLQLAHFQDMCCLQKIQKYLQNRHMTCNGSSRTVFDNPSKGCFAERYFNQSH